MQTAAVRHRCVLADASAVFTPKCLTTCMAVFGLVVQRSVRATATLLERLQFWCDKRRVPVQATHATAGTGPARTITRHTASSASMPGATGVLMATRCVRCVCVVFPVLWLPHACCRPCRTPANCTWCHCRSWQPSARWPRLVAMTMQTPAMLVARVMAVAARAQRCRPLRLLVWASHLHLQPPSRHRLHAGAVARGCNAVLVVATATV